MKDKVNLFVRIGLWAVLILGFVQCTPAPAVEPTSAPPATSAPEAVTLELDNDGTMNWDPATVWQKDQFEAKYPYIKINFHETPYDQHQEQLIRMASGAQEPYDVWQPTDQWIPGLMDTGIFMPIDQLFPPEKLSLYAEWQQEAMRDNDGNIVGVPVFGAVPVFMYRVDLLEAAGYDRPPATWEELATYAVKLTDAENNIWGFVDTEDSLNKFWHWLIQAGGKPFNDDGTAAFNSDAGVTALQFLVDLRNEYKVVPPGASSWMTEDEQMFFIKGNAAMTLSWAYGIDRAANSEDSVIKDKFSVAKFPVGPGNTTATAYEDNYYFIPKNIKPEKLDAALKWLDYVSSYEAQVGMLVHEPGNYVSIPSAYDDPKVKESVPFADILKAQVETAVNVRHANQSEISDILLAEIQAALLGQKTPKQALDDAAAKVNELVK